MKLMRLSRLWVLAVAIALAGCTDTLINPTRLPPDRANFAVTGAADNGNEVHLHFEGLADREYFVGRNFQTLGITFSGLMVQIIGVPDYPGWHDHLLGFFPVPNGSTVLYMGGVHGQIGYEGRVPYTYTFYLFDPVEEFSMVIYPENDSDLTCYDSAGRIVGAAAAVGSYRNGPNTWTKPYLAQTLKVAGHGIVRCNLRALGGAIDDIRFRRERNDLTLECIGDLGANRVTRGKEVVCTATAEGASADWKPSGWKFTGAKGLEVTPADPEQQESRTWTGVMVAGGTVTVTAVIAGQSKTASATVEVVARDWSNRTPAYSFERQENGEDPRLALPERIQWSEDLGAANWFETRKQTDSPPDYTAEILGGPNEGMKYFEDDTNIDFHGIYTLNTAAMQRGSNFYNAQERGGGGGGTRVGGMNWCDASVITGPLPGLVQQHEEYHGSAYARALAGALPSVLTRLESTVDSDIGILYDAYDAGWDELDALSRSASMDIHKERGNPGRITPRDSSGPCALKNESGNVLETSPESES
jgi:hypothetical protein